MKLLKRLYEIYSPSKGEKKMRKFIRWWILNNIKGATVTTDSAGNLLVTKGQATEYSCIVAHLDQVQKNHSKDFRAIETKDIILGFSLKNKQQQGLGADDKNGIWVVLKCLQKYDNIKCAFFVSEEIGCVGSSAVDLSFFSDCRFVLQCDRRNGNDLITSVWGDLCSKEFLDDIDYEKYGYKPTHGLITDVATLKERGLSVCALNISCGYYQPHTDTEFTVKAELKNSLNFVCHIIEKCQKKYPHIDNSYGCFGLDWKNYDPNYEKEDEYWEIYEIISDYLTYQPGLPAELFYDSYKDTYPHLTKEDYYSIVNEIQYASYDTDEEPAEIERKEV